MEFYMTEHINVDNWKLSFIENRALIKQGLDVRSIADAEASGLKIIPATVPGSYEIDFMREGLMRDIYFGLGSYETQKLENLHLYYFANFSLSKKEGYNASLRFGGIDTAADIYLDGHHLGFVENMFHSHSFDLSGVNDGEHEIAVHILPSAIYARKFEVPAMCFGLKYNHDALTQRKAMSMFGWDIMPRIVSGGLWKPVTLEYTSRSRIVNPYTYTEILTDDLSSATLLTALRIETDEDFITDFTVTVEGVCNESRFFTEYYPYSAAVRINTEIKNPKLWWPKNYGDPDLYDVTVRLLYKGVECDKVSYTLGVRSLWLNRTSCSGDDGEFCFVVNKKKIFVMGTNWVPTDALPARQESLDLRAIELVNDLGCNMIRCWGGNLYPSETLYNYCDRHGIMIWQDFALACGHYPDDERLNKLVREEINHVVIEKRQHPSLAVWAGDNECDSFVVPYFQSGHKDGEPYANLNPNLNRLTRGVVQRQVRELDATRPYLPSSPYIDDVAYVRGFPSEDHIWGPRDFFKGSYYLNPRCHFASEIGYHGCPSPESIKKFIPKESLPKNSIEEIYTNPDWLIHASGMEPKVDGNPYAYRLPLMVSHVKRIFSDASDELELFARQSQVSQAEAKKFFIERFRVEKWRKTGILWWNVIDGWPQVSDAIVDWYGTKKLAYGYIKRAQQSFSMICAEPISDTLDLVAVNDTQKAVTVSYTVTDLYDREPIANGCATVEANGKAVINTIKNKSRGFYLIEWSGDESGKNHYVCNIGDGWSYKEYESCMKEAGFYEEFEGFES